MLSLCTSSVLVPPLTIVIKIVVVVVEGSFLCCCYEWGWGERNDVVMAYGRKVN